MWYGWSMDHPLRSISVSELKNKLLEVVRRVENGEAFEITKGGTPVAVLSPRDRANRPTTGFARIEIKGSLGVPAQAWTHDVANLKPHKKTRRSSSS
jgi:prevent-host-death family protein